VEPSPSQSDVAVQKATIIVVHPGFVRVTHWVNAAATVIMILSGWGIYDASPLFGFRFPHAITLGGWLGGSIAWHFAAMWLFVLNGLAYLGYGLIRGHFARRLLPLTPRLVWADAWAAFRLKLRHRPGTYNAVQRASYVGVLVLGILLVLSGLSLWKPVQLQALANLMGGYETARRVHFLAMAGLVLFIAIHLALIVIVPSTLPGMITGRARVQADVEVRT
jgi:thiosulfate reductase cytochrome b subunit